MRHMDTDHTMLYADMYENRDVTFSPPTSPPASPCVSTVVPPQPAAMPSTETRTPLRSTAAPFASAQGRTATPPILADEVSNTPKTSLMLANLPNNFTRTKLMDVLRAQGIAKNVDFIYVPADFKNKAHYNYAFVNLSTPEAAEECLNRLNGFNGWGMPSEKACEAAWCTSHQGLDTFVERYRNSRIMHGKVDDEYKPALFKNGRRVRFPPPTKVVRAPRIR